MEKKSTWRERLYLILILAFFYLPILYVVFFSFNSTKSLSHFTGFSLQWYQRMFADRSIMTAIWYTVLCAVIATAVSTVVGTITAIGLSKSKKVMREAVNQVNNLPMLNPDIVTAIGFMLFFTSMRIETGFTTMVLAHIAFCIPYVILSITPKLRQLDSNIAEAAMDLGCTPLQALWKVIIPQIKEGIVSGALVAFTMSFDDFVISLFTTGPGVSNISIYVYANVKRVNPTINALSAIIVYVITIVLVLVNVVPVIRDRRKAKQKAAGNIDKVEEKPSVWSKAVKWAVAVCLAVVLVRCGSLMKKTGDSEDAVDAKTAYGCNVLNVYNWGEYIGEDVVANFEKKFNATVNYDVFESNEILYTKLMGGSSYDVLVPSDYMVEQLISEGMLQKLDKSAIPNLANLDPDVADMQKNYDPSQEYTVPYFWGSVGIVYNKTTVDPAEVKQKGWDILHDSQYAGRVFVYDSQRDSFMMAFKALGYSMNTDNEQEIQDAYQWLLEMARDIKPAYATDEMIDGMVNGEKDIAIMYSGDAAYVLSQNPEMDYWEPESGTNLWSDSMVIPANSSCPGLANAFINYIMSDEVAMENSEFVGYASTNGNVLEDLSSVGGTYYGNDAYMPRTGYDKDEVFHYNKVLKQKLADLWNKVKISN